MRWISALAVLIAASLALAACGGSSTSSPASSEAGEASPAAEEGSGGGEGGESEEGAAETASTGSSGKTVGVVDLVQSDPLNQEVIKGVEDNAKAKGWGVKVFNANGDADAANSAFRTYANEGVDMILDLAFPTSSIGAGLDAARSAGIPVGGWGSGLAPGILMTTVDDVGKPSVEAMVKEMNGEGDVLALFYTGGQVCRERQAVFQEILKENPNIDVEIQELTIPGETTQGQNYTTAWTAQHPEGSGNLAVWGCWDSPMYGAIAALRQEGRSDEVKTYSINGSPQAIQAVKEGVLTNEVWENGYKEGQEVFDVTLEGIEAGQSWKPKVVRVPGIVVTQDNVEEFLAAEHK